MQDEMLARFGHVVELFGGRVVVLSEQQERELFRQETEQWQDTENEAAGLFDDMHDDRYDLEMG